jgi:hypothetical protein
MAKRVQTTDDLDRKIMIGGPQGNPEPGDGNDDTGDADDGEDGKTPPAKTVEEQLEELRLENARLKGQVDATSTRRDPAPQPKPSKKERPKREWEKMFFEKTDEAVETLRNDIKEELREELTASYQQDVGEKEFWNDFWAENPDLKKGQDADIAQLTLQKNWKELGDLKVADAIKKLGDLTRDRILQYTGGKKKETDPKSKARVEAGGERKPVPKADNEDDNKIVSLSDLVRARRANRLAAANKAQTA